MIRCVGDFCMVLWEDQNGCYIQDYANYRALGDFSMLLWEDPNGCYCTENAHCGALCPVCMIIICSHQQQSSCIMGILVGCWLLLVSMHGIIVLLLLIINNNKGIHVQQEQKQSTKALTHHYLSSFELISCHTSTSNNRNRAQKLSLIIYPHLIPCHINSHPDPHYLHLMLWELKDPL